MDRLMRAKLSREAEPFPGLPESTSTRAFEILRVPVRSGLKWELGDDTTELAAAMEDHAFVEEQEQGVIYLRTFLMTF